MSLHSRMHRTLQLAALPRPARVRLSHSSLPHSVVRPVLHTQCFSSTCKNGKTRREPGDAPKYAGSDYLGFHRRKTEGSDYEEAAAMARARKAAAAAGASRAQTSAASTERAPATSHANLTPVQSVSASKGKGKEIAAPSPSANPTSSTSSPHRPSGASRRNAVGVQLLPPSLHKQLFPGPPLPDTPPPVLDISLRHLDHNGLQAEAAGTVPEFDIDLPPLQGSNIREHFLRLGREMAEPYLTIASGFAEDELPPMPKKWVTDKYGWTKYHSDGSTEAVENLGDEEAVVFDVETTWKLGPFSVMATAASSSAWYSWLSPAIFQDPPDSLPEYRQGWRTRHPDSVPHHLIPLFPPQTEGSRPRIAIGHNVGYDRARSKDEYTLDGTSTRWLDTLALHVSTRGITSAQRPAFMKHRKNKLAKLAREKREARAASKGEAGAALEEEEDDDDAEDLSDLSGSASSDIDESTAMDSASEGSAMKENAWADVTAMNSLAEIARLHLGITVDKSTRDRFGDPDITHASVLRPELDTLLSYCADDVRITHACYRKIFPLFQESCPHPATFSGVLNMGSAFLPVDENWEKYLESAEGKYQELSEGVKAALRSLAEKARKEGIKNGDPWSEQLDWTPKAARWPDAVATGAPAEEANDNDSASSAGVDGETDSVAESPSSSSSEESPDPSDVDQPASLRPAGPRWLVDILADPAEITSNASKRDLLPLVLQMSFAGYPVIQPLKEGWCFIAPSEDVSDLTSDYGSPLDLTDQPRHIREIVKDNVVFAIPGEKPGSRRTKLVGAGVKKFVTAGKLTSPYIDELRAVLSTDIEHLRERLVELAKQMQGRGNGDSWTQQVDWTEVEAGSSASKPKKAKSTPKAKKESFGTWPKWYWELTKPATNTSVPWGELDLTQKKAVVPFLLRLQWQQSPLVLSRSMKWLYKIPRSQYLAELQSGEIALRGSPIDKSDLHAEAESDRAIADDNAHIYFRLPHPGGEGKNVGSPFARSFVKAMESGELSSALGGSNDVEAAAAADQAVKMNVLCSYWVSSRERIMAQTVVYDDDLKRMDDPLVLQNPDTAIPPARGRGIILPQVISMGTVTRRAVEATWLTAANAKKTRIGSELKSLVRAPPGYAIVGADVDSEEMWISSVMGDSQFGMHGATAVGWMTLEGTKAAGTDLHSKTAKILGINRDGAKVFNYSRIYGAGIKHAVQLLLQGDPTLTKANAEELGKALYLQTKGSKLSRDRSLPPAAIPSIWHGGSESYLFNTLESIALSDRPTTPALGCGVTKALCKNYLQVGQTFLPSRINWVVQSSGVDYLHLLITSMQYLIKRYDIKARYLISVHDELRYLSTEEDKYRTAFALQVANAWTRALFCFNLGLSELPLSVTFFSAVDIDHVLRKEVNMTCETPSNLVPIPPGESLDIYGLMKKFGSSLGEPVVPSSLNEEQVLETKDGGQPVRLVVNGLADESHIRFLDAQSRQRPWVAKKWLDALPAVKVDGKPLPTRRKELDLALARDEGFRVRRVDGAQSDGFAGWSREEEGEVFTQEMQDEAEREWQRESSYPRGRHLFMGKEMEASYPVPDPTSYADDAPVRATG